MRSPAPPCPAPRGRPPCSWTGPQGYRCCSVNGTVRIHDPSRTPSDDAVREGNVVLVDNTWRVAALADQPLVGAAPTAVRRAGESVLLPGTREAPRRR